MSCTCRTALSLSIRRSTAAPLRRVAIARTFGSSSSSRAADAQTPPSLSSCPEGTVLKGLNYLKDEAPVVSKPDAEYPAWLWSLAAASSPTATAADLASPSAPAKKQKSKAPAARGGENVVVDAEAQELSRRKRALKLEGRKAIKASNALRG
ncbi:hypothetical protein JCM11491_003896 [Sporobolomyces phaffii]